MPRLAVLVLLLASSARPEEPEDARSAFYVDQSQWVDPGDMLQFDFATSSLSEERGTQTTAQCSCPADQRFDAPDVDCSKTKEKLAVCRKELALLTKIVNKSDGNPKTDAFFRRLSIILMNKLSEVHDESSSPADLFIEFAINKKFVERVLQLQAKGVDEATPVTSIVDEVSDILIPLIQKSRVRQLDSFLVRHFDHVLFVGAAASFLILFYLLLRRRFVVVATVSFVISVLWEWRRLYEEEIIRREITLMSGPVECRQSWTRFLVDGFSSFFLVDASSSSDPCHKYYSSMGVKTILKCNPVLAVQNVFGMLCGGSFALMASYCGEATKNYFVHIPLIWYPFVGAAVLVLLIFGMTFTFGYDVRVPFVSLQRSRRSERPRFSPLQSGDENHSAVHTSRPCIPVADKKGSGPETDGRRRRAVSKSRATLRTQSLNRFGEKGERVASA